MIFSRVKARVAASDQGVSGSAGFKAATKPAGIAKLRFWASVLVQVRHAHDFAAVVDHRPAAVARRNGARDLILIYSSREPA